MGRLRRSPNSIPLREPLRGEGKRSHEGKKKEEAWKRGGRKRKKRRWRKRR